VVQAIESLPSQAACRQQQASAFAAACPFRVAAGRVEKAAITGHRVGERAYHITLDPGRLNNDTNDQTLHSDVLLFHNATCSFGYSSRCLHHFNSVYTLQQSVSLIRAFANKGCFVSCTYVHQSYQREAFKHQTSEHTRRLLSAPATPRDRPISNSSTTWPLRSAPRRPLRLAQLT
jgi:hypothetical protein